MFAGGEQLGPLPSCHWSRSAHFKSAGPPLVIELPKPPERGASATLTLPSGKVESTKAGTFCLADQYTCRSTNPIYGPVGLDILEQGRATFLIPDGPLRPGRCEVRPTGAQLQPVSWSFFGVR